MHEGLEESHSETMQVVPNLRQGGGHLRAEEIFRGCLDQFLVEASPKRVI